MNLEQKMSVDSSWSKDDDNAFERAIAIYSEETENRWEMVATIVPGKSIEQLVEHYEILVRDIMMIESGLVPLPDYQEPNHNERSIWECDRKCKFKQELKSEQKQKRRKGIAWTANEHRQFLHGLEKYGKGDWRSISRNLVMTRTPTQVASHAQKYFARLNSKNKNRHKSSIYDIIITEENIKNSTEERTITCQNKNINVASSSNSQAFQTTSQPSLDLPLYGTPNPNTWSTQAALQPLPSSNNLIYGQSMVGPMASSFGTNTNHLALPNKAYGDQSYPLPYSSLPWF